MHQVSRLKPLLLQTNLISNHFYNTLAILIKPEQNFSSQKFSVERDNSDEIRVEKKNFFKKYRYNHFMLMIDYIWSKNCSAFYKML